MNATQGNDSSKAKRFGLAVSALVTDAEGRYLLLKRSLTAGHFPGEWEAPGGKIDKGESFDVALLREVKEETGLDVVLEAPAGITEFETEKVRVVLLHMRARAASTSVRLSDEHVDHAWLHPDDFETVVLCPKLRNWRDLVVPTGGGALKS